MFPLKAWDTQIIPGFRKDCMIKRVGVGPKRRGQGLTFHCGWDFWQVAEALKICVTFPGNLDSCPILLLDSFLLLHNVFELSVLIFSHKLINESDPQDVTCGTFMGPTE